METQEKQWSFSVSRLSIIMSEKIQVDVINLDSTFTQKKIFNKVDFIFKYADTVDNKLSLPIYFNENGL